MNVLSECFSLAGLNKLNEDYWATQKLPNGLFIAAVADGVGGQYGGSIASQLAISTVLSAFEKSSSSTLESVFEAASQALQNRGREDLISTQMATTLSICVIHPNGAIKIGHVGDSRIYHLRGNGIVQRTKDQTEVAALVEAGILSREQAKTYPRRTVLRSALSAKASFDRFESAFEVQPGDRLLLLTDGVYRLLTKTDLRDFSLINSDIKSLSYAVRSSIEGRNDDDATCIFLEFTE